MGCHSWEDASGTEDVRWGLFTPHGGQWHLASVSPTKPRVAPVGPAPQARGCRGYSCSVTAQSSPAKCGSGEEGGEKP